MARLLTGHGNVKLNNLEQNDILQPLWARNDQTPGKNHTISFIKCIKVKTLFQIEIISGSNRHGNHLGGCQIDKRTDGIDPGENTGSRSQKYGKDGYK